MRLNMTGVNMCGLQMVSNLRSLGLKSSKFSRLAGAAPQADAAIRLKAGARPAGRPGPPGPVCGNLCLQERRTP